jgi:hypothetical protein
LASNWLRTLASHTGFAHWLRTLASHWLRLGFELASHWFRSGRTAFALMLHLLLRTGFLGFADFIGFTFIELVSHWIC